jgi:hypothetical protein
LQTSSDANEEWFLVTLSPALQSAALTEITMNNIDRSAAIKSALAAAVSNARDTSISAAVGRLEAWNAAPSEQYTASLFPFTRSTFTEKTKA